MPINRYDIRNVYGLADPEQYKSDDNDDPEVLLEGVSMAGLVGVLRQLGDLAEFASGIFHDLHEEVMATAARGHGILVRVQQLKTEIPSIERAFLTQTSHSDFFSNSGTDRHPNRKISQNHISTGHLPRFVKDSYEKCRGPPRLFLLDKFDVAGTGACLKRYTDPSVFNVKASSYESESAESQRDKRIHKVKLSSLEKEGSRWKGRETPEVSQPSHTKLHQLFVEEHVQTGATEPAHCVKLKTRPKRSPYDSGSGESYMIKLLNSPLEDKPSHEMPIYSSHLTLTSDTSNGSSLEIFEDSEVGPSLCSPMQNRSPDVSSSVEKTVCKDPPYILEKTAFEEVDEKQTAVDEEIQINGLQNGYLSDDVASDSENETSINHGTYSDSIKDQLQSQISDSQSIENRTIPDDGNNSIKKHITISLDNTTTSTAVENASPVGVDFPPRPFASIEIPFCLRVPPVAEKTPVTQNPDHNITNDTCIAMRKAPNVDQVATLGEGTLKEADSNEVCSNHSEKLDSPRKSEERQKDKEVTVECISEHSYFLPTAGDVPSFSFVGNHKRYQDNKYPNDVNIPMIHVPDILETIKNQVKYAEENHSKSSDESQSSSPRVVNSHADKQPFGPILAERYIHLEVDSSHTTFSDDISVAEEIPVEQLQEILHGMSDPAEAGVSYTSDHETESNNSEIEPVTDSDISIANRSGCNGCSILKDGRGLEEIETESTYSDVNTNDGSQGLEDDTKLKGSEVNSVNSDMETIASVLVLGDIDKHENNSPVSEKSDDNHSVINQLCIKQDSTEAEKEEVDQFSVISPDDPNNDVYSTPYSTMSVCDDLNKDVDSPSINSKILHTRSHSFLSEMDQKQEGFLLDLGSHRDDIAPCDLSNLQLLYSTTEATVFTESDSDFNQLHIPIATEGSPLLLKLGSLTQVDHKTRIDCHCENLQSSFESYSVPVSTTKFLQSGRDEIHISDQYEIAPCDPETNIFTEADHGLESKSMNLGPILAELYIHDLEVDSSHITFNDDISVAEEIHVEQVQEIAHGMSDPAEARVSCSGDHVTESDNSEMEHVTVSDLSNANRSGGNGCSVIEDGRGLEEIETESTYSDVNTYDGGKGLEDDTKLKGSEVDLVNSGMETIASVLVLVDIDKHENNSPVSEKFDDNYSVINQLCIKQDSKEAEKEEVGQLSVISPDDPNNDVYSIPYSTMSACDDLNKDVDSLSINSKILHTRSHSFLSEMDQKQDSKEAEKEEVDQLSVISPEDPNNDVYSTPYSTMSAFDDLNNDVDSPSINLKILHARSHSFLSEIDQKQDSIEAEKEEVDQLSVISPNDPNNDVCSTPYSTISACADLNKDADSPSINSKILPARSHSFLSEIDQKQDSKEAEKEEVDQISVISPDDPNNDVYSIPYSTMSACDDLNKDVDSPSIHSKILPARSHSFISEIDQKQDSMEAEKEEVDQLSVISLDDPNNDVYSTPYSTISACDDLNKDVDSPSINSKILYAQSHSFLSEIDQKQEGTLLDLGSHPVDIAPCDLSKLQLIYSPTEATVFTQSDNDFDQLHMQLPLATEASPLLSMLGSLTQVDHETHIDAHFEDLQSSFESYSVPVSITKFLQSARDDIKISDQYEIAPCDPESNIVTEADHVVESKSMNHGDQIDIFEAPQSSPLEDKVNQPNCQLDEQLLLTTESYSLLVSEKNPTMEFMQASSHDINAFDQLKHQPNAVFSGIGIPPELAPVKLEHSSPLPPPSPFQWRVENLQNSLLTRTDDGQHSDSHFPAFFKSTTSEGPQVVSYSTLDEIQSLDTANKISFSQRLSPKSIEDHDKSSVSSKSKSVENLLPEEAVASIQSTSNQEVFCPSIHLDSLPLSTTSEDLEVVSYSTIDKIQNFDTENQISSECSVHTEDCDKSSVSSETKSDDNMVPQAAVESIAKTSDQEVFWPSSNRNPLRPIVVEMENNIQQPMKIQRPHSPLLDAVTVLDKTKLRKVSDLDITRTPKGKERDTILDQIKAKSFNLKPAIQTRPSIQSPNTNLRLAAILEKAHAIRQAFVGSDDDDNDSWSDK